MTSSTKPKICILYYSTWGHIRTMATEMAKGVKESGCDVVLRQVQETLPQEVLKKMYAVPQDKFIKEHPIIKTEEIGDYDGFLFGVPTRFGMMPSQFKAFWDRTGGYWKSGGLIGKPAGVFFCTGTQGGGQETTALTFVTQLTHHGMLFVPIGYSSKHLTNMDELHGGSPYGAGTYAGGEGGRQPSKIELEVAHHQGKHFGTTANALFLGRKQNKS